MKSMKPALSLCAALALSAGGAAAQTPAPSHGPSLPPALRTPTGAPAASGQALRNEAMHKLQRRFEQADLDASGSVTREEAQRAGLGFVVASFEQIDSAGRGKVSFADVQRFMQQKRKEALQTQEK
jgi:hypothetical protein